MVLRNDTLHVLLNGQEPSINQANAFESLESKLVFFAKYYTNTPVRNV